MENAQKLELHYFFNDDSHSMDACIRNSCEAELLALIQHTSVTLGIEVGLDAEALKEGGLRNIWKFIGENCNQLNVLLSLIAILVAIKGLPSNDNLDDELKRLSVEEKRLNIERLKKELQLKKPISDGILVDVAQGLNEEYRVIKRKSNFFSNLQSYSKITGIGLSPLTIENRPTRPEILIPSSEFHRYVLATNQLPDDVVDDAEIEIVSPVIKEGKYKWRGIYQNETISFSMNDADFKNDVLAKRVSFQHGAKILCLLKISKELDETGEVIPNSYTVITVLSKIDGDVVNETLQGRRFKFTQKQRDSQQTLFGKPNE